MLVLFTRIYARDNYYKLELEEEGDDVRSQSIAEVLANNEGEIIKMLPAPYQHSLLYDEVIKSIK